MTVAPVGASGSLASVDDLAAYLQQDPANIDQTQADFYLKLASATVRGYLRSSMVSPPVTDTVVLDPCDGLPMVVLPEWPVTNIGMVEISYPDLTWRDVTGYVWASTVSNTVQAHSGEVLWPLGPATWRVTYTHGWDSIPDEVSAVVAQVAGEAYASQAGVQSESIGGYTVRYEKGGIQLNVLQQAALAAYRNPVLA